MISQKLFDLSNDPTKGFISPKAKEIVPFLNFSNLDNVLALLKTNAEELQKLSIAENQLSVEKQKALNEILYKLERSLIQAKGLPKRPWYKHQIYAPGYYTGYGVKTLPGIREAIEQRNWAEAQENIEVITQTIGNYNEKVAAAISVLKSKF